MHSSVLQLTPYLTGPDRTGPDLPGALERPAAHALPDPTRPDLTVSHPRSSTTKPQEAKKEARIEREEFALTGGNKKLTKKERKRLEQAEFE